jgi:hypothetical protein
MSVSEGRSQSTASHGSTTSSSGPAPLGNNSTSNNSNNRTMSGSSSSSNSYIILAADVSAYEEYLDKEGNVVTHYLVNVSYNQQSYQLKKRYSEFSELYTAFKDLPLFANYRFPNKSLFNTHSQFTKERRRLGFDELVKLASAIRPLPQEVSDFLELEDDCGPAMLEESSSNNNNISSISSSNPQSPASSVSYASPAPVASNPVSPVAAPARTASPAPPAVSAAPAKAPLPAPAPVPAAGAATSGGVRPNRSNSNVNGSSTTSHGGADSANNRVSRRMGDSRLPKGMVDVASLEQELNVQKRDYFLQVLPSSTCLASAAYATLVAANVIDITSTTTGNHIERN